MDDTLGLRALSLNLPQIQDTSQMLRSSTGFNIDALSTLESLIALTPGFFTANPVEFIYNINFLKDSDNFVLALNYIKDNLGTRPLYDIIRDDTFQNYLSNIMQNWWNQKNNNPPDFFYATLGGNADPTKYHITLENGALRYLEVYRQEYDRDYELISTDDVATGLDCMESEVPVSWGSMFNFTAGENATLDDYVNVQNPIETCQIEYWIIGPGFKDCSNDLPPEIEPDYFASWGRSVFEFTVAPIVSSVFGISNGTWSNWDKKLDIFKKLYEYHEIVSNVNQLQNSNGEAQIKSILYDSAVLIIQNLPAIASSVAGGSAVGSAIAGGGKYLAAATAGLSVSNMIMAYSYWDVICPFSCSRVDPDFSYPKLKYITAGTFTMGSPTDELGRYDRETQHTVTLTNDFYMSETEITNQQYADMAQWAYDKGHCTARSGSLQDALDGSTVELLDLDDVDCEISFSGGRFTVDAGKEDHPVKEVSWYGAVSYCDWLSLWAGFTRAYNHSTWQCNGHDPYTAEGYRLPTEAEWEYACRAGTQTPFNTGNCLDAGTEANYNGNYPYSGCPSGPYEGWTVPVGSYPANSFGLYDMHGNVWEWCNDWYGSYGGDETDPVGPSTGTSRVRRGGGWNDDALYCRSAYRSWHNPTFAYTTASGFGFVAVPVPASLHGSLGFLDTWTLEIFLKFEKKRIFLRKAAA